MAVSAAAADGENVTLMLQVADTAKTSPVVQVVPEVVKSAAFVPVMDTGEAESVTLTLPLFVTVPACDPLVEPTLVLGKAIGRGVIKRLGAGTAVPVPVRVAVAEARLLRKVKLPVRAPTPPGVKVTEIRQVAAGARVCPFAQSVPPGETRAKSEEFVPEKEKYGELMVKLVLPVLVAMKL